MIFLLILIQVPFLPPCDLPLRLLPSDLLSHLIYSTYLPPVLRETDFGSSEKEDLNSQSLQNEQAILRSRTFSVSWSLWLFLFLSSLQFGHLQLLFSWPVRIWLNYEPNLSSSLPRGHGQWRTIGLIWCSGWEHGSGGSAHLGLNPSMWS